MSILGAGVDTTAGTARAVIYCLIKNPRVYNKLMSELDACVTSGMLDPEVPVKYSQGTKLLYLQVPLRSKLCLYIELTLFQACIKEAMRLHPAVGAVMERVVPSEGATIGGYKLPPGTIVGICSPVYHRTTAAFGQDAQDFRPERWIEVWDEDADDSTRQTRARMERNWLTVSQPRTTMGRWSR